MYYLFAWMRELTVVLGYSLDKGSVEVRVEISIGFYGNLVFGFTKDCTPEGSKLISFQTNFYSSR